MRKIREFLPKSEQFFSKKGKGRSPPSPYLHACLPYNKEKKKKTANGNACLKGTETGPCDVQGKAFFFNFTQMKPIIDICQGFLPYIQLEHWNVKDPFNNR